MVMVDGVAGHTKVKCYIGLCTPNRTEMEKISLILGRCVIDNA